MKKIYVIVLSIIISSCASQVIIPTNERIYQEIISIPNMQKDKIFELANKWIAETFKSAKAVIEYQNKETGEIIGNGIVNVTYSITPVKTEFTLLIEIKDEKVRITFKNMRFVESSSEYLKNRLQIDAFSKEASELVKSMKNYFIQSNSNW